MITVLMFWVLMFLGGWIAWRVFLWDNPHLTQAERREILQAFWMPWR